MIEPRLHHATLRCPFAAQDVFLRLRQQRGCIWLDSALSNPHGDGRYSLLAANPISRLRFIDGASERIDYENAADGTCTERRVKQPLPPLSALEQWLTDFGYKTAQEARSACGSETSSRPSPPPVASIQTTAAPTPIPHGASAPLPSPAECEAAEAMAFFSGGAVGYLSYELGRQWERHTPLTPAAEGFPQMDWALYPSGIVCDQQSGHAYIIACSTVSADEAQQRAQALLAQLHTTEQPPARLPFPQSAPASNPDCNGNKVCTHSPNGRQAQENAALLEGNTHTPTGDAFDRGHSDAVCSSPARSAAYMDAVAQTRGYIAQGDIYQTNIAQYFSAPLLEHPSDLYLRLRGLNPAPYAAYIDTGAFQILSSSPELFLQQRDRLVRTRPIKGTRPRGRDAATDAQLRAELLHSPKERAELLMIVDLERNDLGRVCEAGSVRVESMYEVKSYATVHHLMADVCGTLKEQTTLADLLHATFPGGSITGAPKVRAMEIIDELEKRERGIFYGAIGLISLNGNLDMNIAIRTLLCAPANNGQQVHVAVGAGLVWDSDAKLEYEETLHKAEALLKAIHTQPDASRLV